MYGTNDRLRPDTSWRARGGKRSVSAARHVEDNLFARSKRDTVSAASELSGVPVLSKLADGAYELGSSGAKELSASVRVLLLASASAAARFGEKVNDEGSPCAECSYGEIRGFHWCSNGDDVATEKDVIDGEI